MNLLELLTPERIELNVEVADWYTAIRKVGRLLVDDDCVEERYIESMIQAAEELGPYIVVAPGIAMPHSRPETGVILPCMAAITLRYPVHFGNKENDPVKLVLAFGAVDNNQHVEALEQIVTIFINIFKKEGGFQTLYYAKTPQEFLDKMVSMSKE